MMFRVGLVGCGGIAHVHAEVLHEMKEVDFTACADIRQERAREFSGRYGCAAYASLEEMLDRERLDAVHLCTPHYLHPPMASLAADRGIAVFTEKPPAIDETGWCRILTAAEKVPVGVCFQNRYNGNVLACEKLLREGTYGTLKGIRAFVTWNRSDAYYEAADWKGKWATEGGGAIINQAIHTLDLVIRFLGTPDRLEATLRNHHLGSAVEVEDTAEVWMTSGDRSALLFASNAYAADAPVLIELQLEKAVVRLENDTLTLQTPEETRVISCPMDAALGKNYWGAGHRVCIRDFYDSLQAGRPFANRPETCEDTMRAVFEIYRRNQSPLFLS